MIMSESCVMKNAHLEKRLKITPFSQNDLELNKQGKFSEPQRETIQSTIYFNFGLWLFFTVTFFAPFLIVFPKVSLIAGLVGLVSLFGLFMYVFIFIKKLKNDGEIEFVEGMPDFEIHFSEDETPYYSIKINNLKFGVDEETYYGFTGKKVRVFYFAAPNKIMLSAEIIDA